MSLPPKVFPSSVRLVSLLLTKVLGFLNQQKLIWLLIRNSSQALLGPLVQQWETRTNSSFFCLLICWRQEGRRTIVPYVSLCFVVQEDIRLGTSMEAFQPGVPGPACLSSECGHTTPHLPLSLCLAKSKLSQIPPETANHSPTIDYNFSKLDANVRGGWHPRGWENEKVCDLGSHTSVSGRGWAEMSMTYQAFP